MSKKATLEIVLLGTAKVLVDGKATWHKSGDLVSVESAIAKKMIEKGIARDSKQSQESPILEVENSIKLKDAEIAALKAQIETLKSEAGEKKEEAPEVKKEEDNLLGEKKK